MKDEDGGGMLAGRTGTLRRGGLALVDQVLSSGGGLLLMVLVARETSAATFGALSVALLVHGFLLGTFRALVCEVAVMRARRAGGAPADERSVVLGAAVACGLCSSAILLVATQVVPWGTGRFLLLIAVAAPIVYLQDVQRYLAYGSGDLARAVQLDGTWLLTQALVSALLLSSGTATPTRFVWAWIGGAALSVVLGGLPTRIPSTGSVVRWLQEDGRRASAFVGDFVVSTGLAQASFLVLALLLPLEEFGSLRLAFVALSPLANVLAGVRVLVLGHLSSAERGHAQRVAARVALGLALAGVAYGTVLVLSPTSIGEAIFGSIWSDALTYIPVVALTEVFRLAQFPAIDFLKVFAAPSALVRTRGIASIGFLTGMTVGGLAGGPFGAVVGVAVATAAATVLWWERVVHLDRHR